MIVFALLLPLLMSLFCGVVMHHSPEWDDFKGGPWAGGAIVGFALFGLIMWPFLIAAIVIVGDDLWLRGIRDLFIVLAGLCAVLLLGELLRWKGWIKKENR